MDAASCLLGLALLATPAGPTEPTEPGWAAEFERLDGPHLTFYYPTGQRPLAESLVGQAAADRRRILADLGSDRPRRARVVLCTGLACMQRAAPGAARIPPWAAGVAFHRHDLVLLRTDSRTGRARDLAQVLAHELAHLALSAAVGHRRLPRWFQEGFAIHQAGEWTMGRVTALGGAVLGDRLFSLEVLTDSFPTSPPDVELAYAQSIDFVAWLLGQYGRPRFHRLIGLLDRGWSFINAIEEAYDQGIFTLEADWHTDLNLRFTWIPLVTGTASLWGLATLVLVAAWLRKRRSRALAMRMMPDDDEAPPPLTPSSP